MNIPKLSSWIFFTTIFVGFIFFSSIVNFATDWWWFSELGFAQIFIKTLSTKIVLALGTIVFTALFLLTNLLLAIRSKDPWGTTLPEALFGQPISLDNRIVKTLAIVVSLVAALFFGLAAAANWQTVLKFISSTAFNISDPIFNQDIAFYLFSLPVFHIGLSLIKTLIFLALAGCTLIYFLGATISF